MNRWLKLAMKASVAVWACACLAEPWIATRFAQNCAACHAPGRINVPASHRRCTLSCQGCHTNPSGGGLRSFYGKWNEERWLNSFYFRTYKMNKPRPMPTDAQIYSNARLNANLKKQPHEAELRLQQDFQRVPERFKKLAETGVPLQETLSRGPESLYDRYTTLSKEVESNRTLSKLRIPTDDPWRETRDDPFNAGMDFRYFYIDKTTNEPGVTNFKDGLPMAMDIGASLRPIDKLTAVVEARFLNGPPTNATSGNDVWDDQFNSSEVRSAYVLVDDLPYNTYMQYGIYRPMFGHYSPDHTSLFSFITGLNQESAFKTFSIGTAPNVPFANLHIIQPRHSTSLDQTKGLAFNLGGRFVTLGAYGMFSYWDTSDDQASTTTKRRMSSFTGGFTWKRWTFVGDATWVDKEVVGTSTDTGSVYTLENHIRFWRENYLRFDYESADATLDLKKGSTRQISVGVDSFLISSLENEILYQDLVENPDGAAHIHQRMILAQVHYFF